MAEKSATAEQTRAPHAVSQASTAAWIMLALLFMAYIVSMLDRAIIGLLVEPIKADLHLSDTEIGLLQGLAFFIMYSLVGIPMGFLADRVHRIRLLVFGITLWSLMTCLCGVARQYGTLFLARVGVGIGEATLSPTAYSLLADSFPRRRLGLAIGIFAFGGVLGGGLAFVVGGYVAHWAEQLGAQSVPLIGAIAPWQTTFAVAGLPGLAIAFLLWWVPEPSRSVSYCTVEAPWRSRQRILAFVRENRKTLLIHHLAGGIPTMVTIGVFAWIAPYFARVHDWSTAQIGASFGSVAIASGVLGLLGGGIISDYVARHGWHMRFVLCLISGTAGAAAGIALLAGTEPQLEILLFGVILFSCFLPFGVGMVTLQEITPAEMRGFASALFIFVMNMLGSAGPPLIALMSDQVFTSPEGIRYSLGVFILACFLCSLVCFASLFRPYGRSLRAREYAAALA